MARKKPVKPSLATDRKETLLRSKSPAAPKTRRCAEVAGGTAAECAAVCCCCPCGVMNLLILLMYKLPAELFRKALVHAKKKNKNKKKLLLKKKTVQQQWNPSCDFGSIEELEEQIKKKKKMVTVVSPSSATTGTTDESSEKSDRLSSSAREVSDLEEEMWVRFRSNGFWRSPSLKEDDET